MAQRKSAREKLGKRREPELVDMPESWVPRYGAGKLLIPTPADVAAEIRSIPFGHTQTTTEVRHRLAERYHATATCPLVFGIFWRLIAEAAEEDRAEGIADTPPYWRVVKEGGKFNDKLPGGVVAHKALVEAER